jgi:hypothetical protein
MDQPTLHELIKHIASFRYHHGVIGELKDWGALLKHAPTPQMKSMWGWLGNQANAGRLVMTTNWLRKSTYLIRGGPHLGAGHPTSNFRNFQLRLLLERHRGRAWSDNMDLVVDRWSMNKGQEDNLRGYLRENLNLQPRVAHVTIADSAYVEALQVVDLCTRVARKVIEEEATDWHHELWTDMAGREVTGGIYSSGGCYAPV